MKLSLIFILFILSITASLVASADGCPSGELRFSFKNLEVRKAFSIFADFAGLKSEIDTSITESSPMNFDCMPWEKAARKLASQYKLDLRIEHGVMRVSKRQ